MKCRISFGFRMRNGNRVPLEMGPWYDFREFGCHLGNVGPERDIINGLADHGSAVLELAVEALMASSVLSCKTDDNIVDLMATMTEHRVRHIPVIEYGEFTGIVSIGDVVKNRIAETEHEAELLREYISSA